MLQRVSVHFVSLFLHASVGKYLGCFYFMDWMNHALMNICVQVWYRCVSLFLLGLYPGVELLGHFPTLSLIFLRNCQTAFKTCCLILHSHQQCMRNVPVSLHPHQHLFSLVFLIIVIHTGVRCYLTVVLICITLMISYVEHLFIYLLATHVFIGKMSIQVLCPLKKIGLLFCLNYMGFLYLYFGYWLLIR